MLEGFLINVYALACTKYCFHFNLILSMLFYIIFSNRQISHELSFNQCTQIMSFQTLKRIFCIFSKVADTIYHN